MTRTLQLRKRVGAGAVSTVYSAVESSTDRVVALKKSRVSQRASRPTLRHEAATMRLLKGHPSVPDVLAYSHLPHFEYLAMELLGSSLSEVVDAHGPMSISVVSNVATQMIDALEHLHSFGLVHRDIKPHNILFRSQAQGDDLSICLIDYGMVSKAALDSEAPDRDPEPQSDITGTLAYASLRAHVSGRASVSKFTELSLTASTDSELSYRDDLESLAYTLCSLALGSLPWERYNWRGTYYGRVRQVYQQKRAFDGNRLAGSLPKPFADLLDYSRRMSAQERPAFDALRVAFSACDELHAVLSPPKSNSSSDSSSDRAADLPPPPIEVGQVVLVRVAPRLSIETPQMQLNDPPVIADSTITDDELTTAPRLGVVASIRWVSTAYKFTVVGIGRLPSKPSHHIRWRPVGTSLSVPADDDSSCLELQRAAFYTFIRPTTLYIAPGQALVPKTLYVADPATAFQDLSPPRDAEARFVALKSPDPDVRHDGHMQSFGTRVFATLAPVSMSVMDTLDSDGRGWFDECARVVRRLHVDNGIGKWTGTPAALERVHPPWWGSGDSYMEDDLARWHPANVDRSATLTLGNCEGVPSEHELLEGLDTIESVVDEVPPGEDEWFSDY